MKGRSNRGPWTSPGRAVRPASLPPCAGAAVPPPPSVPVALVLDTAFEPGVDWAPAEVLGARAALGLLRHLVGVGGTSAAARAVSPPDERKTVSI